MKTNDYFKGYYFKHSIGKEVFSFIISQHTSRTLTQYASIQFINSSGSYIKRFAYEDYVDASDEFKITIGDNIFSTNGIKANIQFESFHLQCDIQYGEFVPLESHIMGPFKYIPFMECNHDVYSLTHSLSGYLVINNTKLDLTGGYGYIEGDKGASFPEQYFWTQANFAKDKMQNSVMLAIATIPMIGFEFMGVIAEIYYKQKHYRLATYHNVKLLKLTKTETHLKQGNLRLKVTQLTNNDFELDAPKKGLMEHKIKESPACLVRYEFYEHDKCLFNQLISTASFEAKNL